MEVELLKGFEALAARHLERFNHVSRNLAEQLLTVEEGLPLAAQKQGKVLPWLLRLEALDRQVFVVLSKLFPDVQEVLVLNLGQQEAKRSALSGRRVGPVLHHFNYFLLAGVDIPRGADQADLHGGNRHQIHRVLNVRHSRRGLALDSYFAGVNRAFYFFNVVPNEFAHFARDVDCAQNQIFLVKLYEVTHLEHLSSPAIDIHGGSLARVKNLVSNEVAVVVEVDLVALAKLCEVALLVADDFFHEVFLDLDVHHQERQGHRLDVDELAEATDHVGVDLHMLKQVVVAH